ncbi:MAG TPA: Mur ligase family protein [Dokdonella sp.]|uniref:Mur ligase family protein n=1 Tax=Dokdonella sp. TaxID=2291710 RepID=UPI002D80F9E0|nr:Mur ligase family protein [Dokdonella sp.]HET9031494.1 Mur ligase family protein [Dokdonella sp.]
MQAPLSFEDSRRLTGPNLYFAEPGAVLETISPGANDTGTITAWQDNVRLMCKALGWPHAPISVRAHRRGAALAFAAPIDQLFSATEVNEWAWQAARGKAEMFAPGHALATDPDSALHTLRLHAASERHPELTNLLAEAAAHDIPSLVDDESLTLGHGRNGRSWPLDALPALDEVPWSGLGGIPIALVTGSNGKTTSVRLLAAMLKAHGLRTGFSCTDGVFFDGQSLETGDYSGPGGARTVLRQVNVDAAVLETARGGLLRRGLAIEHANAAIVTNISDDHFGEYGIDDLDGLTEAKLIVARALDANGVLVLNADNEQLRAHAASVDCPIAWFSLDDDHDLLRAHRLRGGTTCGVAKGRLLLSHGNARNDLGLVAAMPLSVDGRATYNISNIAGVALLADALGITAATMRGVFGHFGRERGDNPGRLERWHFGGIHIFMDYAHNPEGLRGLLTIAESIGKDGRLGLILGQAGNREEPEIRALAATAAAFSPDLVVLKDMQGYMRGRADGEVADVLRDELLNRGMPATALPAHHTEIDAVRHALGWARRGDLLVLPVHGLTAKHEAGHLFDRLKSDHWQAGQALPG